MYNGYHELNKLPAKAYLEWRNFRTKGDDLEVNIKKDLAKTKYDKGFEFGQEVIEGRTAGYECHIAIGYNGVWGGITRGQWGEVYTHSYEGIGYHAGTADLLHGFLDSGAPFLVCRWFDNEPITYHWIVGGPLSLPPSASKAAGVEP